jgi:pilus assembly protein CpaF
MDWELYAEFEQRVKPVAEQTYANPSLAEPDAIIREKAKEIYDALLSARRGGGVPSAQREAMFEALMAEAIGFGPLDALLADDTILEIMVNGPANVFVEQRGVLTRVDVAFRDEAHVLDILKRLVSLVGDRVDLSSPVIRARLPDGSRLTAVLPPVSLDGPIITIRKFSKRPLTVDDFIRFGSMTPEIRDFLRACIIGRLNIIVSGGTGAGKTTLLNVLSSFIPNDERLVMVERLGELQPRQQHVVRLESRPPDQDGSGEITVSELVETARSMRPDRLLFGDISGGEAFPILDAMCNGFDGSMASVFSYSPGDTLARLDVMCLMSRADMPVRVYRVLIATGVDLIVHIERLRDGTRKVVKITEVTGMEGVAITTNDLFVFEQTGLEGGKVIGHIRPTGLRPGFIDRIEASGVHLPPSVFGIRREYPRAKPAPVPVRYPSLNLSVRQPKWTITTEDEIRAAPAVSRDTVFVGSYDQHVYAIELATGAAQWTFAANGGIASSPVVDGRSGLLYVGSEDGAFYCLELYGRKLWSYQTDGKIRSAAHLAHEHVFFGSDDGFLYVLTASEGKIIWRYDFAAPVRTRPLVTNELCIAGSDNGELIGLELSGNRKWSFRTDDSITASPSLDIKGELCYCGASNGYLYALDEGSGFMSWRYRSGGAVFSSPVAASGLLYFGSSDKTVYALDAQTAQEKWKFHTGGAVVASPVVHDGSVYIGSTDGSLYCLDALTGHDHWRLQTNGPITGAACISGDLALVGSLDGTLYAVPLAE